MSKKYNTSSNSVRVKNKLVPKLRFLKFKNFLEWNLQCRPYQEIKQALGWEISGLNAYE